MTWSGARRLGISTISDTVVPWLPGKAAAALWSLLPGTGLPWEAPGCLPMVTRSSFAGGILSKLPNPRSEQTLAFVPGQRIVCPDIRKALLRTLCARKQSGSS